MIEIIKHKHKIEIFKTKMNICHKNKINYKNILKKYKKVVKFIRRGK